MEGRTWNTPNKDDEGKQKKPVPKYHGNDTCLFFLAFLKVGFVGDTIEFSLLKTKT